MRIVAGQYRGKKLYSPDYEGVRPTSEKAREAIFNILNSKIGSDYSNLNLLDIFAGTGAFGFEAISRGFNSVTFVDINTTLVNKNVSLFPKEKDKFNIIKADATKYKGFRKKFDMFFCDAPYMKGLTELAVNSLLNQDILTDNAIGIIEVNKSENIEFLNRMKIIDDRIYGIAHILFVRKNDILSKIS